jgi:hypothetical protein
MENKFEEKLYKSCLDLTRARSLGKLSKEQVAKLDKLNFPWEVYEKDLKEALIEEKKP